VASATVGVLRVLLTGNSAEFDAAMKKAADSAKVWSKDLTAIGRQAQDVGMALTKTLTLPIAGLAGASVKAASDFESSFAGIRKTVSDATDAMGNLTPVGERLAQGMRDLALTIPVNVNELNRIGEAAGQLGIKSENILGFTRVMADLGVTTNLSSDQAATALARLANITGMPQEKFADLGNVIVHLGNNLATTEAEIVEFGLRIAGAGTQVGLSEGQILAFGAALSSVGINAEAGGTAISKVFITLASEVANGGAKLEQFAAIAGVTAEQFAAQFKTDAAGATVAFVEGLGRIRQEGGNVFGVLEDLGMSEIRLRDALLRASGAGDLLRDSLVLQSDALREGNALSKEAEQRYRTFENQLALFWAQVRNVGIELGASLLPILRDLMTATTPLVQTIGQLAGVFASLPQPARLTVVGVGALVAALGPAVFITGQMITALGAVTGAFAAKGIAMRALQPFLTVYTTQMTAAAGATMGLRTSLLALVGITAGVVGAVASIGVAWANLKNDWTRFFDVVFPPLGFLRTGLDALKGSTANVTTATGTLGTSMRMMASHGTSAASAVTSVGVASAAAVPPLDKMDAAAGKVVQKLALLESTAPRALVPMKEGLDDAGESLQNVAAGFESDGSLIIRTLNEAGKATGEVDRAMEEWARTTGAVFAPAVREARTDTEEATEASKEWSFSLESLAGALTKLAQVSGNTFGGIVQQIATVVAAMNTAEKAGNAMAAGIAKMRSGGGVSALGEVAVGGLAAASALGQATAQGSTLSRTVSGMATGAKIGMAFGPWGAAIGAAAGAVVGLVRGLASVSEAVKQSRKEVEEFQQAIHKSATAQQVSQAAGRSWALTVITVRDAFLEAGRTAAEAERLVAQMWNTDKPEAARQAMLAINAVLANQRIEHELLEEAIREYGFTIEELGPKFQAQRLSEQAQRLVEHYAVLIESGIEQGVVTERMAEKTNAYLATALRTNAEIPKSMEPMLAKMLEQGLLTDENGEKLTDLSRLTWAETMTQGFDRVVGAVERLINALTGIPNQIGIDVVGNYIPPEIPGVDTADPGFATGTMGRLGKWLADFGAGTPTVLHGKEMVVPQAQIPALFGDMLAAAAPSMPSLTAGPVVNVPAFDAPSASASLVAGAQASGGGLDLSSMLNELRALRRIMSDLPGDIKLGYKAALAGA
jgi:TP901 family phage tail tape measure protein